METKLDQNEIFLVRRASVKIGVFQMFFSGICTIMRNACGQNLTLYTGIIAPNPNSRPHQMGQIGS